MGNNRGNTNENDKTGDIISWVIVIILMFAFPPAGWILLLVKLGVFANRKAKNKQNTAGSVGTTASAGITGTAGTANTARTANTAGPASIISKKKQSRLDKKTGKGVSFLLFIVSLGLFIAGASMSIGAITSYIAGNPMAFAEFGFGLFWLFSGVVTFLSRNVVANRFSRYKNYNAFIKDRDIVPISAISQMSGMPVKKVVRDLQAMINNGYLDSGAYIDNELECLVLSAEAAAKMRTDIFDEQEDLSRTEDVPVSQYAASLAELREANSFVQDETISKKVSKLEDLTEKIFKIVEENPQKKPQLKRFMSYYLPTTLKLVRSYVTLEKQGIKGENIMTTKSNIDNILDTLSTGFEQQLDQLFKSDAIDIATDINVLENLMQQDGLTSDKAEFKVAEAGG